jgi:hypothetical protein
VKAFAIDLDDRAVSFARGGCVLASSPSAVFDGSTDESAGKGAWNALRSHPTATSSRHLEAVLTQPDAQDRSFEMVAVDLAHRLEGHRPLEGESVWVASPAIADARGLGSVLGILRGLGLPVGGFIDSATATTAALAPDTNAIVLELGLHRVAATAVEVTAGTARRRRSIIGPAIGLIELHQALLERVSSALVKRTRFDPRHDAVTEQELFDEIPALLREVSSGVAKASVRGGAFEVELSRDELAQAAHPLTREVLRLIHELRPAGTPAAVIVPAVLAGIPGLQGAMEQFVGCDLISCADGFVAAAVSLGDYTGVAEHAPVHLLRRAPLQSAAQSEDLLRMVTRDRLGNRRAGAPPPTHLLLEGRALAIGSDPVVVGRSPGERVVVLPEGLAGVSRRHCTFLRDGSELVLLDHSSFGTFVNGERVAERVRVYAGDRVRLGEPGIELALITIDEPIASTP